MFNPGPELEHYQLLKNSLPFPCAIPWSIFSSKQFSSLGPYHLFIYSVVHGFWVFYYNIDSRFFVITTTTKTLTALQWALLFMNCGLCTHLFFLGSIPGDGITLLWGMHVFSFTRCKQNIFQSGYTSLDSQYCVYLLSHPLQYLIWSEF